jgi:hypothetical protein
MRAVVQLLQPRDLAPLTLQGRGDDAVLRRSGLDVLGPRAVAVRRVHARLQRLG